MDYQIGLEFPACVTLLTVLPLSDDIGLQGVNPCKLVEFVQLKALGCRLVWVTKLSTHS